ncbi:sodium/potassium-transporting ATPase subunit beta-1-interacting protein isoform X1 [Tribolium castaneum]|uniref:Sodium/potassium-transporting ATPase subunit beta-1-interacting protein n=1 Tax=Tribolium castaneum TaxID=7070 RepID=A0A139WPS8_TRICA|nr:PREDICTED: sodium/potassium-transporting ATPase subunit beta-1-interacting protein isoform X1 [Tribolium castaneum]KYB29805.1 Sodium/potassium-transporting ATPase subunit beta-1-interacting protein-like Protein [Tribolium castaneum]|eukprot:XP_008200663.1 PREDICTED: sodium/potassium-transporting ATPase subunit beta-1-interacting protein isoform X1 [Tribolium castaneum]
MGFCSRRYFFLSVCLLQMLSVIERQVFDFLGFLWIPILVNFFEIIFIILGFFGAYQYRPKYIISYILWHLFWLGWNVFIICLYLDVANLDHKTNKVLKLDPKSESWWSNEGPGCKRILSESYQTASENCLVNYVHVEIFQAGLQCVASLIGIVIGICLSRIFLEEDDTSSRKSSRKNTKRMSLYSIEFSSQLENRHDSDNEFDNEHLPQPVSPKPMTPRRVKRRSVMTRGSSGRHSTISSSSRRHSTARSSTRSSRRMTQNPVTRLLEQQQKTHAYDSPASPSPPIDSPLPNYYNSVSNNNLAIHQNWQHNGHSNPTYQQSSTQSLNDTEDFDDLYNNRPASVRSSYSNFHGTRTINYNAPKHYHSHATPQVPQKRNNPGRNSMRSMAFLNNGPPAYTSQRQASIDSETTI